MVRWRRQLSVSRSSGPYRPSSVTGWVAGGGVVSATGGASLTFLEQATAAVQSSATSRTRLVAFMANPRHSRVVGDDSARAVGPPGRFAHVAVREHQSLAHAA